MQAPRSSLALPPALVSPGIRNSCCRDAIPNHPRSAAAAEPEPSAPFTSCPKPLYLLPLQGRCRGHSSPERALHEASCPGKRESAGGELDSPRKGVASPKTQVCRKEAQRQAQGSLTSPCLAEGHTVHLTPPAPHGLQGAGTQATAGMHRAAKDKPLQLLVIFLLWGRTGSMLPQEKECSRRNAQSFQSQGGSVVRAGFPAVVHVHRMCAPALWLSITHVHTRTTESNHVYISTMVCSDTMCTNTHMYQQYVCTDTCTQ